MSSGYGLTPLHLIHNFCSSHPKFTLKSKSGRNRNTPLSVPSIDRPSQGVKALQNNAIMIMTVIILMGHGERKPDVVAFED